MSDHDAPKSEPAPYEPKVIGMLAEFEGPEQLVAAARGMRDRGYRKVEAFSPFPVHGIDEALAAPKPILPWVVFGAGLTGCVLAVLMQWYMNAYEAPIEFSGYDYHISGKPDWSLPANIPVTFELVVLFSAFTAFFGMIAFNALPRFSNPLFRNQRFLRATDDKFFLLVDANDPQFGGDTIAPAFESVGSTHVEPLYDQRDDPMPAYVFPMAVALVVAGLVPLALIAMSRGVTSQTPRLSIWWDMDYQPKFKDQTTVDTQIFADGRAARLPVAGTVSRSGLTSAGPAVRDVFHLGYQPTDDETFPTALLQEEGDAASTEESSSSETESTETTATPDEPSSDSSSAEAGTAEADSTESSGTGSTDAAAAPAPAAYVYPWVTEFPKEVEVNMQTMKRGQERYDIYCAVCHGLAGDGDGLVAQRAVQLEQPTWRPPTSLHVANVAIQPVGKIYDTITNGNLAGKTENGGIMRGGMPAYGSQISVADRWAIVLYVKALQKTRTTNPDELTEQELASIKK